MEAEKQENRPRAILQFIRFNERGASMLEYALLASCIAVVAIASVTMVGDEVGGRRGAFTTVGNTVAGVLNPDDPDRPSL